MFPIRDTIPNRTVPITTWTLIALNVLIFLFEERMSSAHLEQFMYVFGIVPMRFTHPLWAWHVGFPGHAYWALLTSMFLHGGWFHIISNMWALWIFGDNVEDRMGHGRFLLFYLLCGLSAGIVQIATNPLSTVPTVGASGAIAGVLAAYMFLFPFSRIICVIFLLFIPIFFEIRAVFFILIWFFIQFFSGTSSLLAPAHGGGIAWWAHVGGFATGALALWFFLKGKPPPRRSFADEYGVAGAWRPR